MVETKGREVFVRTEPVLDNAGVPFYPRKLQVSLDDKVLIIRWLTRRHDLDGRS